MVEASKVRKGKAYKIGQFLNALQLFYVVSCGLVARGRYV